MKPVEYSDDFLNLEIDKEYFSYLISKLEEHSITLNNEKELNDSKTKTMLQVYEISKKLLRKRNNEAKMLGEELSHLIKECYADYNKLYESTIIKETSKKETGLAKKSLLSKLKTSNIFTNVKEKKRNIKDLRRSLRDMDYEESVVIAKEINTEEAGNLLFKKAEEICRFSYDLKYDDLYTLLKGTQEIFKHSPMLLKKIEVLVEDIFKKENYDKKYNNLEDLKKLREKKK